MTDNILISSNNLILRKPLWSEEEILVARCMWFDVNIEANTITINMNVTFRKAVFAFLEHAFVAFSTQPQYAVERMELHNAINAYYRMVFEQRKQAMSKSLPWYNQLWAHQKNTIAAASPRKVNFFSLQPRLGKTICTASVSIHNNVSRTVVVTFDIGKWNWMYDMTDEKWGARHILDETNFTILDRTKKRSMDAFEERFVIINYDSLHNFIRRIVDGGPPIGHIILSECQKIKNFNSAKWKNVYKLVSLCPDARITFESGTPIMNRADDLFSYFRLVGHPLGEKYSDFKRMFLQVTGMGKREKISGTKNIKLLQLCMSNFMIRYTQEECTDIPKHSYVNMYFNLDEWKPHYQEALEHARKSENRKVLESYIHSINRVMAMAKIPGVIEHTESLIDAEEKVVILTLYQDSARKIADHFGDKCVLIDGSVDGTEKVERSRRFKSDPNVMVAVVNMMAAGHTISLASASHGIVLSLPLSPKTLEQATDRLKDITKTRPSTIYYALCRDDEGGVTVDERLMALNSSKDSDIAAVIDNKDSASMQENAIDVLWRDIVEQKDEV